jgi:hypothetical protein
MNPTTEDRLRAAFEAKAAGVTAASLDPARQPPSADVPQTVGSVRQARWIAPLLAAAAVAAITVGIAAVVRTHQTSTARPAVSGPPRQSPSMPTTPTANASASAPTRPPNSPSRTTTGVVNCYLIDFHCPVASNYVFYQPLWPFADYAAAQTWKAASKSGGVQPWHLDAGQTALLFTRNYLGFTDITTVTGTSMDDQGTHVSVGYPAQNGKPHTAAVLHLVRYSPTVDDSTAGWEVVGSDDTDFSLEQPAYGSKVTSPMTVGGHITGVDENITVLVLPQAPTSRSGAGLPAGGQNSPWHVSVEFSQRGVFTIVASTGGHVTQHERFAIQGVHT